MEKKQPRFRVRLLLTLLFACIPGVVLSHGQNPPGAIPKKPRSLEDYKPRTLRELAAALPDEQSRYDQEEGSVLLGNILPSRVTVVYTGSSRPLPQIKKDLILRWTRKYAGNPDHYTANRDTEMLFTENGVKYWLSIPKRLLQQFEKEWKKDDPVDLYLIRLGSVRTDDKWESVLLVEAFVKPK